MDGNGGDRHDAARQHGRRPAPAAWRRPRRLLLVLDPVAALLSVAVAASFYVGGAPWRLNFDRLRIESTTVFLALFVLATLLFLAREGSYSSRRRLSRIDDGLVVLKAVVYALVIVTAVAFVTKGFGTGFTDYSRRVVLSGGLTALVAFGLARLAAWWWQHRMFVRRRDVRRVVVVGAGAAAADFERFVAERPWLGARVVGALRVVDAPTALERDGGMVGAVPVLGGLDDTDCAVDDGGVDEVVVALDDDERRDLGHVLRRLDELDVPFRIIPSLFEHTYAQARIDGLAGVATVDFRVEPLDRVQRALKRGADVAVALAVLTLLAPLLLVVAALVALTSRGPVLFAQERVGEHGRVFRMLKFRTMYADAEARLPEVAHLNEGEAALFKIRDDPRVTPLGRVLRRWSLDELPQFWNVLRGEMSVVGPRPPLPREVEVYETSHLARLKGKPGITGLWQVSGRSDLTFEQMVDLDRYYLEHWSLGLDLSVVLRTLVVVLGRRGAY